MNPICMASPDVIESVLERIRNESPRPTELLQLLPEFSYEEVQDALSELLESAEVELASDRRLHVKTKANVA